MTYIDKKVYISIKIYQIVPNVSIILPLLLSLPGLNILPNPILPPCMAISMRSRRGSALRPDFKACNALWRMATELTCICMKLLPAAGKVFLKSLSKFVRARTYMTHTYIHSYIYIYIHICIYMYINL